MCSYSLLKFKPMTSDTFSNLEKPEAQRPELNLRAALLTYFIMKKLLNFSEPQHAHFYVSYLC